MTEQQSTATGRAAITEEESRKRRIVFVHPTEIILIKVLAMGPLPVLSEKRREEGRVVANHVAEAQARGLNPDAYKRPVPDTGFCLFQKESGVRIDGLLGQLATLGYVYTGGHWFQDANGKGPVNVLTFSKNPDAVVAVLPEPVRNVLATRRFNNATVWCNIKTDAQTGRQTRLDTINLAKGRVTDEPSRSLTVVGNSYQLT